jgi:hypothetical protein
LKPLPIAETLKMKDVALIDISVNVSIKDGICACCNL